MNNIVDINKYISKRENKKMFEQIIEEIKQKRIKGDNYKTSDMEYVAQRILYIIGNENNVVIPVVDIAKKLGFDTFQEHLLWLLSGYIGINKKYEKKFKTDRVICTNLKVNKYQQRFVIAHELAHFLFDYDHESLVYYNTYKKNDHEKEAERRANAFAANLLMPKDLFVQEYLKALKISTDPIFIMIYLSNTFKTPRKSVLKRISEVGYGVNLNK